MSSIFFGRLLVGCTASCVPSLLYSQRTGAPEDPSLRARMAVFAHARQFRDLEVLKDLLPDWYITAVQDTAAARYARFTSAYPSALLTKTDPALGRFIREFSATADDRTMETFVRAFQLLRQGDNERKAAIELLGYMYSFPSPPLVVASSSHSFARADSTKAIYYLSEGWLIPFTTDTISRRFVVQWFRSRATWYLDEVR